MMMTKIISFNFVFYHFFSTKFANVNYEFIDTMDYWLVNSNVSPAIKYSAGYYDPETNSLRRSRIYFRDVFKNSTMEVPFDYDLYIKWSNNIFTKMKRKILVRKKDDKSFFWYTPRVLEQIEKNNLRVRQD